MNRQSLSFVSVIAFASASACAQVMISHTDAAPYTDIQPARASAGAPSYWKGSLSRADVLEALRQARAARTVATGDAVGYPFTVAPMASPEELAGRGSAPTGHVLGASPATGDRTIDGYRFVGGEAGYAR